jgi:Ni2+-binding GTPase involved in maturation of urease and hydrogenase
MPDCHPFLVVVGGFLGAGKTTLILKAAELLQRNGKRVAAILNDQGAELVDTTLVRNHGISAEQVAGGCFCCRFSDLVGAAERLKQYRPDVIFAEAVGSCTDISATTLQPLKRDYAGAFRLAPYTVLVDPSQLLEVRSGASDPEIAFLFQKQLEEADLVCITKTDLYQEDVSLGQSPVRYLSAVSGAGVTAWLDELGSGVLPVGGTILAIDYEQYARAEAALAWLNCRFRLDFVTPLSPPVVTGQLLDGLDAQLIAQNVRIVHLKMMDETSSGYIKAAVTDNNQEPSVEGDLTASPARRHNLLLNIRAMASPEILQNIVLQQIKQPAGSLQIESFQCFSPAPPKPECRLSTVV